MPLFGRSTAAEPATTTTMTNEAPNRRRSMFGRRNSTPEHTTTTHTTHKTSPTRGTGTGVLHRHHEDASISSARDQIFRAEEAEREADKALYQAKVAVREARERMKVLEKEAAEEARLAKIKQNQAKAIGKRGKALGRHEHV